MKRETGDLAEAVRAHCEKSRTLVASEIAFGTIGGSSNAAGKGRRYDLKVWLRHLPTGIEVTVGAERPGGRTRAQVKVDRAAFCDKALSQLEQRVRASARSATPTKAGRLG